MDEAENGRVCSPKDFSEFWECLVRRQGEMFYTAKGLSFTYQVRDGELFVDRRSKSITRATVERAYRKLEEDKAHEIRGPKKLGVFGAPYLWAIFVSFGAAFTGEDQPR